MGPCPNTKYPIFSQFDKKNYQLEKKFKNFSLIIINFSFIWMFFISLYDYVHAMCLNIGTPINNKFSICPKLKFVIFCVPKLRTFTALSSSS